MGYSKGSGVVVFTTIPQPVVGPANNEIWYTTTTGEAIVTSTPLDVIFGSDVVSNTYKDGKGILVMSSDIT